MLLHCVYRCADDVKHFVNLKCYLKEIIIIVVTVRPGQTDADNNTFTYILKTLLGLHWLFSPFKFSVTLIVCNHVIIDCSSDEN